MGICPGPKEILKKFLHPRETFRRLQITKFWNQRATPNRDTAGTKS